VEYAALMAEQDDTTLQRLLDCIATYGFCFVMNTPPTPEVRQRCSHISLGSTSGVCCWGLIGRFIHFFLISRSFSTQATRLACERIGICKSTMFGDFWDLTVESGSSSTSSTPKVAEQAAAAAAEFSDTAYTPLHIAPHTDGSYLVDPPGLQSFHILHHHGTGGMNQLIDGWQIGEMLRRQDPAVWATLTQLPMEFYYTDRTVSYRTLAPVFRTMAPDLHHQVDAHSQSPIVQFRWNNHDRCPPHPLTTPPSVMAQYHAAVRRLQSLVLDPANQISFKLLPGRLLITNNWRVLHGRSEMTGSRRLVGCYITMDDYLSRRRILSRAPDANWQIS
jgi:alpha-ketoglutarate-dependent taurine dioxygenase